METTYCTQIAHHDVVGHMEALTMVIREVGRSKIQNPRLRAQKGKTGKT